MSMDMLPTKAQPKLGNYLIDCLVGFVLALVNTNIHNALLSDSVHSEASDQLSNDLNCLYQTVYRASRNQITSMFNTVIRRYSNGTETKVLNNHCSALLIILKLCRLQFSFKSSWVRTIGLYRKLADKNQLVNFSFLQKRKDTLVVSFLFF